MILAAPEEHKPEQQEVNPDLCAEEFRDLWDGLALAWPIWEHRARTLEDVSGNGLAGVIGTGINPLTDWVSSPYGACLRLTGGAADKVTVADPAGDLLDNTTKLSFEILFRPDAIGAGIQGLLGKYRAATGERSWRFYVTAAALELQVSSDGAANEVKATAGLTLVSGAWYHVIGTFSSGTYKLWVNGVPATVGNFTSQLSVFGGTREFLVGMRTASGGGEAEILTGAIGSVRVWRGRALEADAVARLIEARWGMYEVGLGIPSYMVPHSGGAAAGPWITAAEVAKGARAFPLTGLANGVSYDVRVRTKDTTGNVSAGSTPVAATPAVGGVRSPGARAVVSAGPGRSRRRLR